MAPSFFDQPILNTPYDPPAWHHALDADGQPLDYEHLYYRGDAFQYRLRIERGHL